MREIKLPEIRTKGGSQCNGFEEMCVQIFRIECGKEGEFYRVDGAGGDGGVEAYFVFEDGRKIGMQAKFFEKVRTTQWKQIDKSVRSMLTNHPDTKKYSIYVSCDRTKTGIKTWDRKVGEWTELAKESGNEPPKFEWVGESEVLHKLCEEPHRQLAHYWFGTPQFSLDWLQVNNAKTIRNLDRRYSPGQHVQTKFGEEVLAFLGSPDIRQILEKSFLRCVRSWRSLEDTIAHTPFNSDELEVWKVVSDCVQLTLRIDWPEIGFPNLKSVRENAAEILEGFEAFLYQVSRWANDLSTAEGPRDPSSHGPFDSALRDGRKFRGELVTWIETLERFAIADARRLLVEGEAGVGKSHLIADVVETVMRVGQPALFLLGEDFTDEQEPWNQLLSLIHWEGSLEQFLSAMNQQAAISGLPGLIAVDALNESEYRRLWMNHLIRFADEIKPYENLKLLVSCRSDFRRITLPATLAAGEDEDWAQATHYGFSEEVFEAVENYFSAYQIRASHFPPLLSEYRNPLFLRTFCEAFEGQELPRGPMTLERVMEARMRRLCEKVEKDIDCAPDDTRAAVFALAEAINENGGQPVRKQSIKPVIDGYGPSRAQSQSLYHHLKSNGILVELGTGDSDPESESDVLVRFPFERFSDYFIAKNLISRFVNVTALKKALGKESQFAWIRDFGLSYENRGIFNALSIVVPETFGKELYHLVPEKHRGGVLAIAFLKSVPWRSAESFSKESELLLLRDAPRNTNDILDVLLRVAAIPGHPYNADFLHRLLLRPAIAKRDEIWTLPVTDLVTESDDSLPNQVLSWAYRVNLDLVSDEQAKLVGKMLIWFLTSNYRGFRKRSTLAAIRILKGRSDVVASLIEEFEKVNDPYVLERLFAVAAGVAMRERDMDKLSLLAGANFDHVFAKEFVNPHILLRDYAQSVLEIANYNGCLPARIEPKQFRPPFRSKWPRIASEKQIKPLEDKDGWDRIFSSVEPEQMGMYGDFGRYVMQAYVERFSNRRRSADPVKVGKNDRFDAVRARRWIIQRVKQLGWTPEQFARYERYSLYPGRMSYDEEKTKVERVSKKYQWIALYELLGYLSDHYHLELEYGAKKPPVYRGMWQIWGRDFDPSAALREESEQNDSEGKSDRVADTEGYPDPFRDRDLCANRKAWVLATPDDFATLIDAPEPGRFPDDRWIKLRMFHRFREPAMLAYEVGGPGLLSMWVDLRAWLVKTKDRKSFLAEVRSRHFWGTGCRLVSLHDERLGEYPWAECFTRTRKWCEEADVWLPEMKTDHVQTVCSWEEGVNSIVPSPQLMELCSLKWSGEDAEFINANGAPMFVGVPGEPIGYFRRDGVDWLRDCGYELVWGVLGERMCYDYELHEHIVEKRREFSAVYSLEGDVLTGGITHDITEDFPKRAEKESRSDSQDEQAENGEELRRMLFGKIED